MADITITGLRVAPMGGPRVPTTLRAYARTSFLLADGVTSITATSPYDNGPYYKSVPLTLSGLTYAAGNFTLPATTDSADNPVNARWGLFVFDQNGWLMYEVEGLGGLDSFWLDHTDPSQSPQDIRAHMLSGLPVLNIPFIEIDGDLSVGNDLDVGGDGSIGGDLVVGGQVTAAGFTGSGAGLHSLPSGVVTPNSLSSTGSVSLNADTDANGSGEAALVVGGVTKFRAKAGGLENESLVPLLLANYAENAVPATGLTRVGDTVYYNGRPLFTKINVKSFGAKSDAQWFHDGAATASSTTFTSDDATFTEDDEGKLFACQGAGPGNGAVAGAITLVGAAVTAIAVAAQGAGYLVAPSVIILGDGQGATATANLTGGQVTSITINSGGANYSRVWAYIGSPPLITTIQTFVNAHEVVLADAASASGVGLVFAYGTDNTVPFQDALDEAAAINVRAVEVNGGLYLFGGTLECGTGVLLTGPDIFRANFDYFMNPATASPFSGQHAVLMPLEGAGELFGDPFILAENANGGVLGCIFFYPLQSKEALIPNPYPPTVVLGHTTAYNDVKGQVCCNNLFINSFWGIFARGGGRKIIEDNCGSPLAVALYVDKDYDVTRVNGNHFTPFFFAFLNPIFDWVASRSIAYILGRVDSLFGVNNFVALYGIGIETITTPSENGGTMAGGTTWAKLVNFSADLCGWAGHFQGAQEHIGITLESCQLGGTPSIVGYDMIPPGAGKYGMLTASTFAGHLSFVGGAITGEDNVAFLNGPGSIALSHASLKGNANAAVYAGLVGTDPATPLRLSIEGCSFLEDGVAVQVENAVRGGMGLSNQIRDDASVVNHSTDFFDDRGLYVVDATYQNSWTTWHAAASPARYSRDGKTVRLEGVVKDGVIGQPIFTLPAGYRPPEAKLFIVISDGGVGRVDVATNGQVTCPIGSNVNVSLDGVSFRIA